MSVEAKVTVDGTKALAKLQRLTPNVRDSLRGVIISLTRQVASRVNSNLDTGLKSRTHVSVTQQLVENPRNIYGRVAAVWTGDASKSFIPQILESGAVAHDILPKNGKALAFFWDRVGKDVVFAKVHHPGFAGIYYMQRAFDSMKSDIQGQINDAVRRSARETA